MDSIQLEKAVYCLHQIHENKKGLPASSRRSSWMLIFTMCMFWFDEHKHTKYQIQDIESEKCMFQYNRGSTNMDLSRDEEGATQDRSNAPITTPHDPEQVKSKSISKSNKTLIQIKIKND